MNFLGNKKHRKWFINGSLGKTAHFGAFLQIQHLSDICGKKYGASGDIELFEKPSKINGFWAVGQ